MSDVWVLGRVVPGLLYGLTGDSSAKLFGVIGVMGVGLSGVLYGSE